MCNCGKKRMEYSRADAGSVNVQKRVPVQTSQSYTSFEYIGKTALTVIGNVTGTQYRFNYPGNRQNIDYRDVAGMISIQVLKKLT